MRLGDAGDDRQSQTRTLSILEALAKESTSDFWQERRIHTEPVISHLQRWRIGKNAHVNTRVCWRMFQRVLDKIGKSVRKRIGVGLNERCRLGH